MNLNVLLRGQSNAFMLGALNGGAQAMTRQVESLLGFDGVTDTVTLQFAADQPNGNTVYSGTSFLTQWLNPAGGGVWQVGPLEQGLLNYVAGLPAAQKAEPTAVVWLHSEYDSGFGALTAAEWAGAVRYDAALLRAAYGQPAAALPYLFVSAIPYNDGTDTGHQAIRAGMEALAADAGFNARIAARALDTDMSFDDWDGNPATPDYGGGHMSNPDGWQTGGRLALALAEQWAAYARPGSPVALAGGQLDDHGPQVVAASQLGDRQLALSVAFDAAAGLLPLDADAAQGVGWVVIGADGLHRATAASLTGAAGLLLSFDRPLPADGRLFYGWGYGRLAGADGSGEGNAVYDDHGMPIWVAADGLGYAARTAPAAVPASPGGTAPPAGFGNLGGWDAAGLVWTGSVAYAGTPYQTYSANPYWGGVDWVHLAPGTWEAGWVTQLATANIPQAELDLRAAGSQAMDLLLLGVRAGSVALGAGNDRLTWVADAAPGGAEGRLVVSTGAGDDRVVITAMGLSPLAAADVAAAGGRYDPAYDGRHSVAELHLDGGRASVSVTGATRLEVFTGDGFAEVAGGGGADAVLVGRGGGRFQGGGGADDWVFAPGSGSSTVLDFTPGEDRLTLAGIAPGAVGLAAAEQDGVAGLRLSFDAAGHSVFLAGVASLGDASLLFA